MYIYACVRMRWVLDKARNEKQPCRLWLCRTPTFPRYVGTFPYGCIRCKYRIQSPAKPRKATHLTSRASQAAS